MGEVVTYAELKPGDKFDPNYPLGPEGSARTVKSVSERYTTAPACEVVAVECTDGYAAEVLADAAAKPQPERG